MADPLELNSNVKASIPPLIPDRKNYDFPSSIGTDSLRFAASKNTESEDSSFNWSAFLGITSAANTARSIKFQTNLNSAYQAYQDMFGKIIEQRNTSSSKSILVDAAQAGIEAMDASLRKSGLNVKERYGAYLTKAQDFLIEKSTSKEAPYHLNPQMVAAKAAKSNDPGDYVVHIMKRNYLNDPDISKLGSGEIAWFAPLDEIAGLKLDRESILRAVGFDLNSVKDSSPGNYLLAVYRTQDLKGIEKPTWNNIIEKAKVNKDLQVYKDQYGDLFFEDMKSLNYSEYSARSAEMQRTGNAQKLNEFTNKLSTREQALYAARAVVEKQFGANHLFTGEGYTIDPLNKFSVREFILPNELLVKTPPHALIDLREIGLNSNPVDHAKGPANRLVWNKETTKGGAIGAASAIATTLLSDFRAYQNGNLSLQDWTDKISNEYLSNAVQGAGTGAIESVVETSTSQAIIRRIGTGSTVLGQALRQMPGAVGAGAVISFGTSTYDQMRSYQRGEVNFSRAAGNVTSETIVGASSALGGVGTGALIGSYFTPGVGTVIGAGVGGIVTGLGIDRVYRSMGWDKAISDFTTKSLDSIQTFTSETWQATKNAASYSWESTKYYSSVAWEGTKSLASTSWQGVKSGASAVWETGSGAVSSAWNWTTSWLE